MLIKNKMISIFLTSLLSINLLLLSSDVAFIEVSAEENDDIIDITVYPNKGHKQISPYIYGINDTTDISDVTLNALKYPGDIYTTYNWETNNYNTGVDGDYYNKTYDLKPGDDGTKGYGVIDNDLMSSAMKYNVPMKLTTLPMLGYVASDGFGEVSGNSSIMRFYSSLFPKPDSYLLVPDIRDDKVYVDEYVSYLVSIYGDASQGGFNGYFLDSEPEKWSDKFGIVRTDPLTSQELIGKSVQLATAVKNIDPTAQIFGPSIKNIQSYVNLENSEDAKKYIGDYTWFIDYYLENMYNAELQSGKRLLDVLDLHYFTEHYSMVGTSVLTSNDNLSDLERIEAVRTLWDGKYTENSTAVLLNKQQTPIIQTVQASIRMYYPGTKLSFSEYNFGGGARIAGGIAEADVLGVFAENDVYMACLSPDEKCDYQKSAINIYTNYDGKGKSFGDTFVKSNSDDRTKIAVYSSADSNRDNVLTSVVINKTDKAQEAYIKLDSDVEFKSAYVYGFNEKSSDIKLHDMIYDIADNDFKYKLAPNTVYMFEFDGNKAIECNEIENENPVQSGTDAVITDSNIGVNSDVVSDNSNIDGDSTQTNIQSQQTGKSDITDNQINDETDQKSVPLAVKIIVSVLVGAVIVVLIYVYFFELFITKHKK